MHGLLKSYTLEIVLAFKVLPDSTIAPLLEEEVICLVALEPSATSLCHPSLCMYSLRQFEQIAGLMVSGLVFPLEEREV